MLWWFFSFIDVRKLEYLIVTFVLRQPIGQVRTKTWHGMLLQEANQWQGGVMQPKVKWRYTYQPPAPKFDYIFLNIVQNIACPEMIYSLYTNAIYQWLHVVFIKEWHVVLFNPL